MVGEQIKALRMARGMSQVALARMLSVSKQSVSNWENNNIMPSVEQVVHIAEFFGCTTDYLLEMEEKRKIVDVTGLSDTQTAHIQQLIDDLRICNFRDEEILPE